FPLEANRDEPARPVVLFHPDGDYDGQQNDMESQALAAWIVHLTGGVPVPGVPALLDRDRGEKPVGYGDIALLLRGVREFRVVPSIERAFQSAGIPYSILGGADAVGSRALELLHAYLSLLLPGDRRLELLHVLESKPMVVGHTALAELFGRDGGDPGDRGDLLSDERISRVADSVARGRIEELRSVLDRLDGARASMDFRRFLALSLEQTPFLPRLFAEGATPRSVEDLVGEVWEVCNTLAAKRELDLWSFLDYLRAAIDGRSFGRVEPLAVPPDHVRVMTIHQAKGLEFPAVAVAGIKPPQSDSSGFFLSRSGGLFSEKWKDWNRGYKDTDERELEVEMGRQEERCLLYVAMTRAKDFLWVSSPYADSGKSLFGDVLAAAEGGEAYGTVIRSAPEGVRAVARAGRRRAPDPDEAASVVSRWNETREAYAGRVETPPPESRPLHFVNWAALNMFCDCPQSYRFRYVLGAGAPFDESDPSGESPAAEKGDRIDPVQVPRGVTPAGYGLIVHDLLHRLLAARLAGDEPPAGWVEAAVERSGVTANRRRGVVDAANGLLDAFESSALSAVAEGMRLEAPFQVRGDRVVYHGVFDRVEKNDGRWTVTDYKIGLEKEEYAFQVAFYAWALGRITGERNVAGRLCYLREGGQKMVAVTPLDLDAPARDLEERLRSGDYAATPGTVCRKCSYRMACPDSSY
ncbi:MAG: PD-(D/E)XK nuclease family protein, partial [Candidatus Latescibacterota bacterium]